MPRLIPAHAGKTPTPTVVCPHHPGSSPLTRGKRPTAASTPPGDRLIPAHAGKTTRAQMRRRGGPAHPRSRGENAEGWEAGGAISGSSPLTRGKRELLSTCLDNAGLIPAHAGKTRRPRVSLLSQRAHPRSRGENDRLSIGFIPLTGSSPLTRGKPGCRTYRQA